MEFWKNKDKANFIGPDVYNNQDKNCWLQNNYIICQIK